MFRQLEGERASYRLFWQHRSSLCPTGYGNWEFGCPSLWTHLFVAFRTGRQEKLIPILRQQQRPRRPLQSSAHPSGEERDLEKNNSWLWE